MKEVAVCLLLIAIASAASAPKWPQQYFASGTFSIPYFKINEPVDIYFDAVNNRERLEYYNKMDTYLYRYDQGTLFQVIPRIDKLVCFHQNLTSSPLTTVLPDLKTWSFKGKVSKNGEMTNKFEQVVKNFNTTAVYTMYVTEDERPVQLHLFGYDFVFGSHPDIYIMNFHEYKPNFVDQSAWTPPKVCDTNAGTNVRAAHRARAINGMLSALTPAVSDDLFSHWSKKFNKVYPDDEIEMRRNIFEANANFIEAHNARTDVSHKLKLNQYADWTHQEFKDLMLPRVSRPESNGASHYHAVSGVELPTSIDWVTRGAVNPPKDQGVCGSCWTFGSAGALEGAQFVKTGVLPSLSEQQIVDCAWLNWGGGGGDSGCDGGFAAPAFWWIQNNGGIATETSYPYLMQDHWCEASDTSSGVKVTGYVNVTSGSEQALMDAVANHGPVAIAIDAAHPEFEFYTSGVYYNPACKNDLDSLDHEVLVVGYGTEDGQDYWLVKNSWSIYWGDKGFIKMSRNRGNNCGIATQATYPLV